MLRRIRWLRIVGTAVVIELLLLLVAVPLNMSARGRAVLLAIVIPMCVVAGFIGGWWAARRAGALFLVHGILVGAAAALIYGGVTWKASLPMAYILANYLKIAGGAMGGLTAQLAVRVKPSIA